jgi:hypothetical protein
MPSIGAPRKEGQGSLWFQDGGDRRWTEVRVAGSWSVWRALLGPVRRLQPFRDDTCDRILLLRAARVAIELATIRRPTGQNAAEAEARRESRDWRIGGTGRAPAEDLLLCERSTRLKTASAGSGREQLSRGECPEGDKSAVSRSVQTPAAVDSPQLLGFSARQW